MGALHFYVRQVAFGFQPGAAIRSAFFAEQHIHHLQRSRFIIDTQLN